MSQRALDKFREFTGREVESIDRVEVQELDCVVRLGRAISIKYESDKKNGGGDGTTAIYEHDFHRDDILCCDASGKMLVIVGPKLRVEDRGIVN